MLTITRSEHALPLQMIHTLFQPKRIVYLGSQRRFRESIFAQLSPATTTIIHTERNTSQLRQSDPHPAAAEVIRSVCSADGGDQNYFVSDHPLASGSIQPERMRGLWQNAACLSQEITSTISINSLLERWGRDSKWIAFDLLGAAQILTGLSPIPVNVLAVSALVTNSEKDIRDGRIFTERHLTERLREAGFVSIARIEDRHPKLMTATYVREIASSSESGVTSSESSILEETLKLSQQKLKLSESNLNELRARYSELAEENQRQARQLSDVAAHLKYIADQSDLINNDN